VRTRGAQDGGVTSNRRPAWLVPALAGHVLLAALVWRDLARRPATGVRGSKNLWRLLSAANTSGSLAYVLVGRKR
jgi:hypothetical protein